MNQPDRREVILYGNRAAQIASLAAIMAAAFAADPETSQAAIAIEGLSTLANILSDDLLALGNSAT